MKLKTITVSVTLAALTLAGCASDDQPGGAEPEDTGATRAQAAGEGATSLVNCGNELSIETPPERAVTLEQNATELLIALGLSDRMAGQGYQLEEPLAELAAEYESVPVINAESISAEQLREVAPDFSYSMRGSFYTPEGVGTVDELAGLGVPSYVSETDCPEPAPSTPASFEVLFDEYRELGGIFGADEAAEELIAEQQQILDDASADSTEPPTAVWLYSTYNGVPIVAAAGGMPSAISEAVGLRNAFDDVTTSPWPEMSWEQIAERDPDVIVVADLPGRGRPGDSAEDKIELLRSDPVASNLSAVRDDHVVALSGAAMDPSIRSVRAVAELAQWLSTSEIDR